MGVVIAILVFLAIMNSIGFMLMGLDKNRAARRQWRIPERALFAVAIFGGALGGTVGMFFFHHKTKHWYFRYGFPAILVLQLIAAAYLIGSGNIKIM